MNEDLFKSEILDFEAEICAGGLSMISFEPFAFVASGIKQAAEDIISSRTKETKTLLLDTKKA
jgi:hypothetical protein